jgi:hypothetical protein
MLRLGKAPPRRNGRSSALGWAGYAGDRKYAVSQIGFDPSHFLAGKPELSSPLNAPY